MIGHYYFRTQNFLFYDMENFIPEQHVLRKISKLLDFSNIKNKAQGLYSLKRGRPSIDLEIFFRMLIIVLATEVK